MAFKESKKRDLKSIIPILRYDYKMPVQKIANKFGIHRNTVGNYLKKW